MRGISTEILADHHWLGDDVQDEFELTRYELLVALWFEATYGQPRYRKRWKAWARQVGGALWKVSELDVGAVELPATRDDEPARETSG